MPLHTEADPGRHETREDLVTATWLDEHGPYVVLEVDSVEDGPPSDTEQPFVMPQDTYV